MMAIVALTLAVLQAVPIGSALSEGMQLVYESQGVAQTPWVYDSVRVVEGGGFERCILTRRQSQPVRVNCVRGDTLFERSESNPHRAVRPVGPNMEMEILGASGTVLKFTTQEEDTQHLAEGMEVPHLPTSIVTRDSTGTVTRRIREHYAPSFLTALWGVFEEPDESGGWKPVLEFSLTEVRRSTSSSSE